MPEPPRGSGRLPSALTVPGWSGTPGFAVAGMGQRLEVRSFYSDEASSEWFCEIKTF